MVDIDRLVRIDCEHCGNFFYIPECLNTINLCACPFCGIADERMLDRTQLMIVEFKGVEDE